MSIETTKKLFTVYEYQRMAEAGILGEDDRVELIDGEIIQMSPKGLSHRGNVTWANNMFVNVLKGRALVSVQDPLRLNDYTEPEPDIVLLKPRADCYRTKHAMPEDAILVVEVADSTLKYDRDVKVPRYAAAGVTEVWIEDLQRDVLLVYRDPEGNAFKTCLTLKRGDSVFVQAFPDITFSIDELLG